MPKARRKPAIPTMPIEWIDSPAQNAGCVVEVISETGKANRKRRYRLHIVERLAQRRVLSESQKLAGLALHGAWCQTMLSPPAVQEIFVDATPRPDDVTVHQVERMQRFADMAAAIPVLYRAHVRRLACDRLMPQTAGDLELARQGLMRLAKHLGL